MSKFKNLKVSEKLSETQYYSVVKIVGDKVQLNNESGESIIVDSKYVDSCLFSASQFTETKNVNKTEMAALFINNPSVVMTVNFNKQVKEADVVTELMSTYENSTPAKIQQEFKKTIKKALEGVERTMVGFHSGNVDDFGRTHFIDMNVEKEIGKTYDTRNRLVDSRTINFLVLRGIKYIIK